MSFQNGAMLNTMGFGNRPENVEIPHIDVRAPSTQDFMYPVGKRWINNVANNEYSLTSLSSFNGATTATWTLLGAGEGDLNTLTGDSGGAISPSAGNINILGTGSEITTTGAGSTITLSLPATLVAPGSLEVTSGFTVDAGTTAITGTTNINTSGAAVTTIGTGGTGATHIGNATGNTAVTGSLSTTTSLSATTSVGAGTTITATLGNITATNGNLVLATAGNKLLIKATSSATCSAGQFTLGGGATTVVSNSAVTAASLILLTTQVLGTVIVASTLAVTAQVAGASFTVTPSQATDTSIINYLIIN